MNLRGLFPSRLTVAAVIGCTVLAPLAGWLAIMGGQTRHDLGQAEARAADLDRQITAPGVGYIAQLTSCQGSLAGAEASLKVQNEAVDGLRRAALTATAQAEAAVRAAEDKARAAERRSQAVLQSRPNPGETVCEAAFRLHRENVE